MKKNRPKTGQSPESLTITGKEWRILAEIKAERMETDVKSLERRAKIDES